MILQSAGIIGVRYYTSLSINLSLVKTLEEVMLDAVPTATVKRGRRWEPSVRDHRSRTHGLNAGTGFLEQEWSIDPSSSAFRRPGVDK